MRTDLPLHDLTGGNYWMPSVIEYLDSQGKLRLGGGMTQSLKNAMHDGALRAQEQLRLAASLEVDGDLADGIEVKVINHTGHKLISGYPEGRRMWLNIKWYDNDQAAGAPLREDGAYGPITVDGMSEPVNSILNLEDDSNLIIYQAHMGMTSDWARKLINLGYDPSLALGYERDSMSVPGNVSHTLDDLAGLTSGSSLETFHFVLNNTVVADNRIPPYQMDRAEAERRYGGTHGDGFRILGR